MGVYQIFKCWAPLHKSKAPYWGVSGDGSAVAYCYVQANITLEICSKRSWEIFWKPSEFVTHFEYYYRVCRHLSTSGL